METRNFKIQIVDDEPDIVEFIKYNLEKEGFQVFSSPDGLEAIELAKKIIPHLILLDVMMPNVDGIETCEELRKLSELESTIIAFLSARSEDYSQIAGYEAGADDYITKPIKPKLLVSKIKALLKRHDSNLGRSGDQAGNSNLRIDKERFIVLKDDKELLLPKKEFELLNLLMSKPNKVFNREEIFLLVWGENIIVGDRTIDVHIRKLREKIGDDYIQTIKGVGYKFVYPSASK